MEMTTLAFFNRAGVRKDKKSQWEIVDSKSEKKIGTHSIYEINENIKLAQGMRMKLMHTRTSSGCATR